MNCNFNSRQTTTAGGTNALSRCQDYNIQKVVFDLHTSKCSQYLRTSTYGFLIRKNHASNTMDFSTDSVQFPRKTFISKKQKCSTQSDTTILLQYLEKYSLIIDQLISKAFHLETDTLHGKESR